jgi:hypothetical protein
MEKELSKEVKLDFDVKDGQVVLSVGYDGKGADAKFSVMFEGDYFLDKLAEAIPGKLDDLVIEAIKGALK